jgi:hypothetical protein
MVSAKQQHVAVHRGAADGVREHHPDERAAVRLRRAVEQAIFEHTRRIHPTVKIEVIGGPG